jgi:hypothetical protein
MALADYASLKAFITAELQLDSDTAARFDDLLALAEAELGRLLDTPEREVVAYATTTASVQTISLPTDFREARTIQLDDDYPLTPVTLNVLFGSFSGDSLTGKPQVYTIANQSLYFGPIPDAAYTMTMTYLGALTGLSTSNTTNWLLTTHPDAYRWALSFHIHTYWRDMQAAAGARAVLDQIVSQINTEGNRYRNAAPMRLRSPVVV